MDDNSIALFLMMGIILVIIMGSSVSVVAVNCPPGKIPKTNSNGVPLIDPDTDMPICVTNGKLPVPPPH
ncbi:MAG TPA: hypothetical protein VEH06_04445 [Candidatus Bathyarchaeia archaeon]|nr:hypothetical protein [Candidatus Bathyarchaeia archaeon]